MSWLRLESNPAIVVHELSDVRLIYMTFVSLKHVHIELLTGYFANDCCRRTTQF
jgi:hypothetical protein